MRANVRSAGIIAAGEGSRFKNQGIATHKPMIPVAGLPLIGHALRNLQFAGIRKVVIIFNEAEEECVNWVRKNFPGLTLEFIVKSTASSFESFWLVGQALGFGHHLLSTVDAFCLPQEYKKMVDSAPERGMALGLTAFVDDEKPLWVRMEETSKRILEMGLAQGDYVTSGLYSVPSEIFDARPEGEMVSLRTFLKWLVDKQYPVYGVVLSKVVDVDTPKDIEAAEQLLRQSYG